MDELRIEELKKIEELHQIDILRERTGVTYEKARDVLSRANGDVIEALIILEKEGNTEKKEWTVFSKDLLSKVTELIKEGNIRKIKIKHKDKTIVDIPMTLGVVGTTASLLFAPYLTIVAAIAAWYTKWTIEIEKKI
ncbi:MAG: DUF4342 domain-containing protein [Actinobacteria bacterium]|nr:DUF4342 domain-containing protein [Actinomycetota bacterium]